jgi:signal transduction histidine kinase
MQFLLVEDHPGIQELWLSRLSASGVKTVLATSYASAMATVAQSRFTMAIFGELKTSSDFDTEVEETLRCLRSRGIWTLRLIRPRDLITERHAYSVGFDDCIAIDCSDESLAAKIDHARHLEKLEQRLAQAQKLESIGELAAGIAHEINTPIQYVGDNTRFVKQACEGLTAVLECCQNLIRAYDSGGDISMQTTRLRSSMKIADVDYLVEEIPAAIGQTLEGVDRVANIVRAMKEFAHPGSTEMTLTDLANAIKNTIMVARNEWKYVANMQTDFDPDLPQVPCLPGELNQVLLNMIVNASHAIAESLGDSPISKGTITMATRLVKPFAEIRISDTGSGISAENIDRIFNPFFTTKAAGKGTGQGLAIAHTVIVEKHGGTIHVESEVGIGTTFIIRIPLEMQRLGTHSGDELPHTLMETQSMSLAR